MWTRAQTKPPAKLPNPPRRAARGPRPSPSKSLYSTAPTTRRESRYSPIISELRANDCNLVFGIYFFWCVDGNKGMLMLL